MIGRVVAFFRRLLVGPVRVADPTCPECHGVGYDASGATCRCVLDSPEG